MKVFDVDLYEYFKVSKPDGAVGVLRCYIIDNSNEVELNRKHTGMLVLPGGGYQFKSFREGEPVALRFCGVGINCFVLNYSVTPIRHPYSLVETYMAMNYIRGNSDELHVDENKVVSIGFSAGGHLCAMLGNYFEAPEALKIFKGKYSNRPDAIILGYPVITSGPKAHRGSFDNLCGNDEKLQAKLDITNLVTKDSSPAFIYSTRDDGCVPIKNSLMMADAYEEYEIPFTMHIFAKGWHGASLADYTVYGGPEFFETSSPNINSWVEMALSWLKELNLFK